MNESALTWSFETMADAVPDLIPRFSVFEAAVATISYLAAFWSLFFLYDWSPIVAILACVALAGFGTWRVYLEMAHPKSARIEVTLEDVGFRLSSGDKVKTYAYADFAAFTIDDLPPRFGITFHHSDRRKAGLRIDATGQDIGAIREHLRTRLSMRQPMTRAEYLGSIGLREKALLGGFDAAMGWVRRRRETQGKPRSVEKELLAVVLLIIVLSAAIVLIRLLIHAVFGV